MPHQLPSLLAHRIRHNDLCLIAAHRTYKRQTDPLIAACRLNDDRILVNQPLFFCIANHIICGPGLDRTAHVKSLKFHEDLSASLLRHALQTDQGSISHSFKNIIINHCRFHAFPKNNCIQLYYYIPSFQRTQLVFRNFQL